MRPLMSLERFFLFSVNFKVNIFQNNVAFRNNKYMFEFDVYFEVSFHKNK